MNKKPYKKGSGFKIILIFIGIVVLGSMLFANGAFPSFDKSVPLPLSPDSELQTPSSTGGQNNLQLETFGFKECGKLIAIDFLLDRSGSMNGYNSNNGDKINKLKSGVFAFTNSLADDSVIGAQDFSSPGNGLGLPSVKTLIPISKIDAIRNQIPTLINSLQANGATYTRDAFIFAKSRLEEAISKYPNYKFALIFISDGIPESLDCGRDQQPGCTTGQDPNTAPSIPEQIKSMGVRIFSIAYLDSGDSRWDNQLQTLMRNVASSPSDYYVAPSSNQIDSILSQIATKICKQ